MTTLDPRAVKIANEAAMEYGGEFTHEDTIAAAITAYLAASPQPALAVKGDPDVSLVMAGDGRFYDEDGGEWELTRETYEKRLTDCPCAHCVARRSALVAGHEVQSHD